MLEYPFVLVCILIIQISIQAPLVAFRCIYPFQVLEYPFGVFGGVWSHLESKEVKVEIGRTADTYGRRRQSVECGQCGRIFTRTRSVRRFQADSLDRLVLDRGPRPRARPRSIPRLLIHLFLGQTQVCRVDHVRVFKLV